MAPTTLVYKTALLLNMQLKEDLKLGKGKKEAKEISDQGRFLQSSNFKQRIGSKV